MNLADFWDRHTRFIGVTQLWESRFDVEALKNSWRWIYERLDRINGVGPAKLGDVPNWNFDRFIGFPGVFPWERDGIREWAAKSALASLAHGARACALRA